MKRPAKRATLDAEDFKRLRHLAWQRGVILDRSDQRDGTVAFFTQRNRELRRHDSEAQVRDYLGSLPCLP